MLVFKKGGKTGGPVVSSYRSSNTHFKYSKWKEKAIKKYSEAAIVEKEKLWAMKSCFEEVHTFLSMRSDIILRNYVDINLWLTFSLCSR